MTSLQYERIKNTKDFMLPFVDYVFCRLFGSENNKDRLISLLNSILNGNPYISDVTIDPTEYKKTYANGKTIRLDINATTDDGTLINIEMQCIDTKYIIQRAELHQAMMLRDIYIRSGDTFDKIPHRISIWITKTRAFKDRPGCVNEVVAMFKATKFSPVEIASEKYRLIVVDLTRLNECDLNNLGDMFLPWMRFIDDPQHMPDDYLNISELRSALEDLDYLNHNEIARSDYIYRLREISDLNNARSESFENGLKKGERIGEERGLKIGEERGAKQKAIETAINLLKAGVDIDIICKSTGLSTEDIECIKDGRK